MGVRAADLPCLARRYNTSKLASLTQLGATRVEEPLRYAMSNSFAFGGNNISLILELCDV